MRAGFLHVVIRGFSGLFSSPSRSRLEGQPPRGGSPGDAAAEKASGAGHEQQALIDRERKKYA